MSDLKVVEVTQPNDVVQIKEEKIIVLRKKTITVQEEYHVQTIEEPIGLTDNNVVALDKPAFFSKAKPMENENLADSSVDDLEERKELARIIGLTHLPDKRPDSIQTISGIFDEIAGKEEIDTTQLVKDLRRRCK